MMYRPYANQLLMCASSLLASALAPLTSLEDARSSSCVASVVCPSIARLQSNCVCHKHGIQHAPALALCDFTEYSIRIPYHHRVHLSGVIQSRNSVEMPCINATARKSCTMQRFAFRSIQWQSVTLQSAMTYAPQLTEHSIQRLRDIPRVMAHKRE